MLSVTVLHWALQYCVMMEAYYALSNSASLGITILCHDGSMYYALSNSASLGITILCHDGSILCSQ